MKTVEHKMKTVQCLGRTECYHCGTVIGDDVHSAEECLAIVLASRDELRVRCTEDRIEMKRLEAALAAAEKRAAELSQENQQLNAHIDYLREDDDSDTIYRILKERDDTHAKLAKLERENERLKHGESALLAETREALADRDMELATLKRRYEALEAASVGDTETDLAAEKQENARLRAELGHVLREHKIATRDRDAAEQELAKARAENERLLEALVPADTYPVADLLMESGKRIHDSGDPSFARVMTSRATEIRRAIAQAERRTDE